jgi:hypothetical protein
MSERFHASTSGLKEQKKKKNRITPQTIDTTTSTNLELIVMTCILTYLSSFSSSLLLPIHSEHLSTYSVYFLIRSHLFAPVFEKKEETLFLSRDSGRRTKDTSCICIVIRAMNAVYVEEEEEELITTYFCTIR